MENELKPKNVTISLRRETLARLREHRLVPRDADNDVLGRVLDMVDSFKARKKSSLDELNNTPKSLEDVNPEYY